MGGPYIMMTGGPNFLKNFGHSRVTGTERTSQDLELHMANI
jgi:hypothetical protein